jgi:hypothetical protein
MSGAETMNTAATEEIVNQREYLFGPVDLKSDGYNCIDDQLSNWQNYAHIGGGVASLAYTRMILAQIQQPGSAGGFAEVTADTVGILEDKGFQHQGVHSSVREEGGDTPQLSRHEGGVGCGYLQLRREISQGIAENGRAYIDEGTRLFPELFDNEADLAYAWQVVAAHEWFSAEPSRIDPGRAVFLAATGRGAKTMLVDGGHAATEGIINTQEGSTLDSNTAVQDGVPCYDDDLWATTELMDHMPEGFNPRYVAIASVIDIIGTMKALNVGTIAVR